MLANRTSRWSFAAALLCLVLLAASWFLLISPRRADASDVRAQAAQSDAQADQLKLDIAELKAQFADLPRQKAELAAIKVQLPPKANIPELIRNLREYADESGASLDSMTPGTPALVSATGTAVTKAGVGSVVTIPLQLTVTGDYFEASLYIKDLQTKLKRSLLISVISVAPAQEEADSSTSAPTVTATTNTGATPTAAATSAASTTAAPIDLSRVTLSVTSSLFVLMDESTTLEDVKRQVRAATLAAGGTVAPTPTGTATPAPTS